MAHEPVIGSLGVGTHQLREVGVALALALCVEGVHHLLNALVGVLHREEELAAGDARVARRGHGVFLGDEQDILYAVLEQTHARAQACQARAHNDGVIRVAGSGSIGRCLRLAGLLGERRPRSQAGQCQPARCCCHKSPTRYLVCLALHDFLLDMNAWFRTRPRRLTPEWMGAPPVRTDSQYCSKLFRKGGGSALEQPSTRGGFATKPCAQKGWLP